MQVASMYSGAAAQQTGPPGTPGSRWLLSDSLRDWLIDNGYVQHPLHGAWNADSAWVFALMQTADLLDAEVLRMERDMLAAGAPMRLWAVMREGGGLAEAGEVEGDPEYWAQDRILFTIYAYTELHALYLFVLDFTQAPDALEPNEVIFPQDYQVPVTQLLETLAWDEDHGRWDIMGASRRLADIDLDRYRLVPSQLLDLNDEHYLLSKKRAGAGTR